jgi:hypothetical protein
LADAEVPLDQVEGTDWDSGINVVVDSQTGSFVLLMRLQETRWRTYYCAKGLTQDDLTPEFIQEKWQQLVPPPGPFKPTEFKDMAFFEVSCKLASTYQRGCVLLAGDAAHCHSPAGGQGMNTGLQDGANLAWKLASVIKGYSPSELLTSYEKERRPIAEWVLNTSDSLFAGITTQRSQIISVARRILLGTVLAIAPDGALPPKFMFNRLSGLGLTYKGDGTCVSFGDLSRSSYIRGGDRLPDAECLERTAQGTAKIHTLQLLNSAPHTAMRLIMVANVTQSLPSREEIEKVLASFRNVAQNFIPIQPVLYMSHAAISGFFGGASNSQGSPLQPYEVEVDSKSLEGFEEFRTLTFIESSDGKNSSGDVVTTMGLRAGGRGLLLVRPDGYIAVSQVDVSGRGKGWDGDLMIDALRQLNYINPAGMA